MNLIGGCARLREIFENLGGNHNIETVCGKRKRFTAADNVDHFRLKDVDADVSKRAVLNQWTIWLVAAAHIQNNQTSTGQLIDPSGEV
jgi:hypothetical protein